MKVHYKGATASLNKLKKDIENTMKLRSEEGEEAEVEDEVPELVHQFGLIEGDEGRQCEAGD